jgi:hypothetical protein
MADNKNRGKTRLAKWYAPYNVGAQSWNEVQKDADGLLQDDEKVKLKGEVRLCWIFSPRCRD